MNVTLAAFGRTMAAGFRRAAERQAAKAEAETTTIKGAAVRTGDGAVAATLADLFLALACDVEDTLTDEHRGASGGAP